MQTTSTAPLLASLAWDDVRLFLTLCRARTMGEAAAVLGVNTSTVSRRLTGLEEALDATLFERGRDGLRPTRSAEELLPAAELVEDGVARFAHAIDGLEREVSGRVRLACPPDAADVIVVPALKGLLAEHPALRVELKAEESVVDLNRREADLALRVVRPEHGDLVMRRVATVRWVLATSPALAERLGGVADPERAPWIGCGERFAEIPTARWLVRGGAQPVVTSDNLVTQIAAAAAGIGVALVPAASVAHYGLANVAPARSITERAGPLPTMELYLVTHRILRSVPRVRVVWDALVEALGVL